MTNEQKRTHTPTPWHYTHSHFCPDTGLKQRELIQAQDESLVATIDYCLEAGKINSRNGEVNAKFIVRACNAHDDLVAALKKAREYVLLTHSNIAAANHNDESPCKPDLKLIDAALEKANER